MRKACAIALFTGLFVPAGAQVFHSCPHGAFGDEVYENPLNEKWLSAYDVKGYKLRLEVSNKNTVIQGSAMIIAEASRTFDTIVFELQDALDISEIFINDDIRDSDFNTSLSFIHANDVLYIPLDRAYSAGETFSILILYGGEAGATGWQGDRGLRRL